MSQIDEDRRADGVEDDPLSPQAQAVMDKARRRAGISMLLMLIGFMAIAVVVVYRLASMSSTPEALYAAEALLLPAGAQVIGSEVGDGLITVTYAVDGVAAIRIFDGAEGTLVREIALGTE